MKTSHILETSPRPVWIVFAGLVVVVALSGCAAPQEAKDQANHSTKLMSLMETQLKELRRVEAASEDTQKKALAAQKEVLGRLAANAELNSRGSKSSGDTQLAELTKKMLADADSVAATRTSIAAKNSSYSATLSTLLKPIPDSSSAIALAQEKMAEMGTEPDRETVFKELLAFAKDVKKSIDDNKEKIESAEKTANAAAEKAIKSAAAAAAP